ncbi:hypothetical protein OFM36_39610, partial [Escherichia coli]|nr:hypothetical protein [Escherichia coli]
GNREAKHKTVSILNKFSLETEYRATQAVIALKQEKTKQNKQKGCSVQNPGIRTRQGRRAQASMRRRAGVTIEEGSCH